MILNFFKNDQLHHKHIRILFLLIFSAFIFNRPILAQDCDDDWVIEVCGTPYSTVDVCTDQTDGCSQRFFYVYLVDVGSQVPNGSDEIFTFSSFSFSGNLEINPTTGAANPNDPNNATQRPLSHLDEKKSKECSPYLPGMGTVSIDEKNNTFAYHYYNDDGSPITWGVDGRRLLFVIAVDAYPDEGFYPDNMAGSFVWLETVQGGGTIPHSCNALITPCTENLGKSVTLEADCTSPLLFRFGSAVSEPVTGFPNRIKIPVFASSGSVSPETFNIDELDLLMSLQNTQPMGVITLGPGKIPLNNIILYKEPPMNQSTNQRIYVEIDGVSLTTFNTQTPSTDNTLFYIYINGPALASSCATTTISFTPYRRMVLDGGCCIPKKGSDFTQNWGSTPCISNCASSLLSVEPLASLPSGADECGDLFFRLMGSSTVSPFPQYKGAEIIMDVHHSGGIALSTAGISPTSSPLCSSCITSTAISADVLRVTLSFSSGFFELGAPPIQLAVFKFEGEGACINEVTFYDATLIKKDVTDTPCQPSVETDIADGSDDDICSYQLSFCAYMWFDASQGMNAETDISYTVTSPNDPTCSLSGTFVGCGANYECVCNTTEQQIYIPSCNLDPLNGVSTFDLVLISRHILGLEPLNSPFKIIAADANNSGTVTTGDIITIRKLILGSFNQFPDNNSYRFLDSNISFSNPLNPWEGFEFVTHPGFPVNPSFLEEVKKFTVPPGGIAASFKAIKIADVDNNVVFFTSTEERSIERSGYSHPGGEKGQKIRIPLFAKREIPLAAWQASLSFDPEIISIKSVNWSSGNATSYEPDYSSGDWNVAVPGELRLSWMTGSETPFQTFDNCPLAWIEVELLETLPASTPLFTMGRGIPSEFYTLSGTANPVVFEFEKDYAPPVDALQEKKDWTFSIYPNPSAGAFRLNFDLPEPGPVVITVFDAAGATVFSMEKSFEKGLQTVLSTALPALPAGQYTVSARTGSGVKTQKLVCGEK